MADTGFKFPGTAVSVDTGLSAWSNPGNVTADDSNPADSDESGADGVSDKLRCTNFDFSSIPVGATIDGIEYKYNRLTDAVGQAIVTTTIRVVHNGSDQGNAKTPSGDWEGTYTDNTQGGASDKWGYSPTRADVQASTWGLDNSVTWDGNLPSSGGANIDDVQVKIYYSGGKASTVPTTGAG